MTAIPARVVALAKAFVHGEQSADALTQRGALAVGRPTRMVRPVAERYIAAFGETTRPRVRDVVRFILDDRAWQRRRRESSQSLRGQTSAIALYPRPTWLITPSEMQPVPTASAWRVRPIASLGALADWLGLATEELEWLADSKGRLRRDACSPLHHYHYRVVAKAHGGLRVIEAPQPRLKAVQRQILTEILEHVPPYYDAAHGFVKGRSVRTFAQAHINRPVVLRLDVQDFFPTIRRARVQALFRTLGYPEAVADVLGALCTNIVPSRVFANLADRAASDERCDSTVAATSANFAAIRRAARRVYAQPHVPQGAPTSPALANLCAFRLDCRLTGLADWAGATYSRYADDLVFSGDGEFARHVHRYAAQIAVIVQDEGWTIQHRKTRIMRTGVRQHVAGVVVNKRLNVPRAEFEVLKATLFNCVRHGPATQNREQHPDFRAHLEGRLAWMASINPQKAVRLRRVFAQIDWRRDSEPHR